MSVGFGNRESRRSRGRRAESPREPGLALYDRADAVEVVVQLSAQRPYVLECLGASSRPEARAHLVAEFDGESHDRSVAAAKALGEWLSRGRDEQIEKALLERLKSHVGPTLVEVLGAALMRTRPAEAADAILDELGRDTLSEPREEAGAKVLQSYLGAKPPLDGVRGLLVKRQDVLIRRLDAKKTESVYPVYVLWDLHTPEAMAALRRAAESFPDPDVRQTAQSLVNSAGR